VITVASEPSCPERGGSTPVLAAFPRLGTSRVLPIDG
jgi:hypothetical protein